jgi:hypothetical protein
MFSGSVSPRMRRSWPSSPSFFLFSLLFLFFSLFFNMLKRPCVMLMTCRCICCWVFFCCSFFFAVGFFGKQNDDEVHTDDDEVIHTHILSLSRSLSLTHTHT